MHHPTVIYEGQRWNVIAENNHTLTIERYGEVRAVKVEAVR